MNKFCENLRVQREICLIFFKQLGIRFRNDLPTTDTKKNHKILVLFQILCCYLTLCSLRFYLCALGGF
jgi:hypothetical protein